MKEITDEDWELMQRIVTEILELGAKDPSLESLAAKLKPIFIKPSPFPEILEGSMSMKITNNEVQVLMGTTVLARHIFLSKDKDRPTIDKQIINTYRIMAASLNLLETGMKVAELYLTMKADVEKSYPGVGLNTHLWGGNLEYENFVDALREAGVDL